MRKLTLSLAVMAALLPVRGYSLGLGELELSSALNQDLNAEIEVLSAAPEDAEQILIKLADRDAFSRAGLDRPYLLQQLKFKMIEKNGKPYVKVYTKTPVSEPFLSFLLEIDWPQGHLLREYTLLLDPPVYNTGSASTGMSPAAADDNSPFNQPADTQAQNQPAFEQPVQTGAQATSGAQTGVISSNSGRSTNYQAQALPVASTTPGDYRVQQNDTLWGIANRMRPDSSISVEQMMLALVRKNPEAFIRENINGVKRGYILRAPSRDEVTQVDRQQAVAQAREHAALWREYSQAAASATPASAMEAQATGGSAADQPRDVDGHLSIVGASDTGSEQSGSNQDPDAQLSQLRQELAMAQEQLESAKLEKEDLRSRLAELEQRVQSVIEMDDGELAKLQQDLQSGQASGAATEEMPVEEIVDDTAEEQMTEESIAEDVVAEENIDETMDAGAENEPVDESVFVDESETDMAAEEPMDAEPMVMPDNVDAVDVPAFAQDKPKNFIENLRDDPKLLGMIGGGLAFVLLLIILLVKRLRGGKKEEEEEWSAVLDESAADISSIDATLDTESSDVTVRRDAVDMDSTAEMVAEPADAELGMGDTQIDAPGGEENLEDTVFSLDDAESDLEEEEETDDVIAEADVYLAYGIYQQAEELLNTAIDQNPDRDDYRMKLLETHYAAKNAAGFEQLAEDVRTRKGDDKSYWDRVVAMGMELCPDNALFSNANVLADFDPDALLPDKPQTTDLELDADNESATEAETDFDLGLDDDELSDDLGELDSSADELDLAGDLDDLESQQDEAPAEIVEDTSEELEFDLGELGDMDEVDDAADELTADTETADLDIDDDFSLDFDAADLGFEESEDDAEDVSLDADLDLSEDLADDVEIGLNDELDADVGEIEIAGEELDLDEVDLGDMDLGETDSTEAELGDLDTGTPVADDLDLDADDSEFDISELSEDVDEVSTKLDLARAYIDMGDNDGARSILDEVKTEGNDEQQQQAEELIQQVS